MFRISLPKIVVFLAPLLVAGHSNAASYIETFTTSSGSNVGHNHADIGWQAHIGTTATDNGSNTGNSGGFVVVPADYAAKANTSPIGLAWTSEFSPFNRTENEISTLSFISNNNNTAGTMRFAVRIENTWFVTSQTFTHAGGGGQSSWATKGELEQFNFTNQASAWRTLDFAVDSTLAVGSAISSDLPAGNLTAAGILIEGNTDIVRYDDFQIIQIPEPAAPLLGGLGLISASLFRRRNKASL
ncbi:MAG: PEP-CTERM sorting domain-containing protein [Verrucomicrobiaceae bacterium]|nr:MAG: PEP-CTERM sorting domain-containing protein [Verrucomicrobiaceae bacterium]